MLMHERSSATPWADRLFERFTRMYGTQRVASMWDTQIPAGLSDSEAQEMKNRHIDAVRSDWDVEIKPFGGAAIGQAIKALNREGGAWPPSLPEFIKLCRSFHRPEHAVVALPAPKNVAPNPEALAKLEQIMAPVTAPPDDPLKWAREPKSKFAVDAMIRGAKRNFELQAILSGHIRNRGEAIKDAEARKVICKLGDA